MARCGCASDKCSCNFIAGDNVSVSGTGSRSNPYVFSVVLPAEIGGTGGGTVPSDGWESGDIKATGRSTASAGWLMCDGSLVDRDQYAALFAAIGTSYGAGDGLSTFKLPDLRDRVLVGASGSRPRGSTGGSDGTTLEPRHLPLHNHSMVHTHTINHDHSMESSGNHDHSLDYSGTEGGSQGRVPEGSTNGKGSGRGAVGSDGSHTHNVVAYNGNSGASSASSTGNAGSASPDEIDTMPPYAAVNYQIKT